ncbi:preprotein translocase subunit SecY [Luteibaculum oceani]|uniref:Protein translocase subunit SecY n=1 Tax=Luteibaculum oceani TaxID=1294296 RepID=A0A5C6V1A6_9FLAO|nr:preprotein translocase subunit SecY [Luteibaculum oceani]TXC78431.1 preprotein translocase subunit SecY [Luteibaculum oceani]
MKNFIETIKNIWSIEELRNRILTTLGLLLIFRIGSYVVIPGVNSDVLASTSSASGGGIADLLSMFTGGAFSRASIFALGIMPYISASIIMQLAGIAIPPIQKMQKEGESGRKKLNQYTRFLTIIICVLQAPSYIFTTIDPAARPQSAFWLTTAVILLTTGCLFVMWLGERITDKGIGNGISLLIMIGIISSLPFAFFQELVARVDNGGLVIFIVEIVALLLVIAMTIMIIQGTRKIPVQYARKMAGGGTRAVSGARQYIPLKVNSSGVMPIIFAQAIMFVPLYIAQATGTQSGILVELANFGGFWYNLLFATMIILFTYFYTAIMVNPTQMADDMKRNGGFIPGVKPGKSTADYLDNMLSKLTLPGSIFLAFIAILPAIAMLFGVKQQFSIFFGGTSLLIMVGVVLDTLQQIESHLLSRHYDGLMKTGKIAGKNPAFGMAS